MPDTITKSRIKNPKQYDALREKGYSKKKAARIANTPDAGHKGGVSKRYEEWTKTELYNKAREIDLDGRSKMSKKQLIIALRTN